MKKKKSKLLVLVTVVALAVGGTIYGFTYKSDTCPMAGTAQCPDYQNCPKKGTADCPYIQNCPKKGTADCPYTNGTASCCQKKK